MEENIKTFTGKLFLKDEHIKTLKFTGTSSDRVITVFMESIFIRAEEKDFREECTFTISPEGYIRVQINFNGNGKESSLRLRKIGENKVEIYRNSVLKEIIETEKSEKFLLDGLNPIFDFYNYMFFVSSEDGVKLEKDVYSIEHQEGELIKKKYIFEKKDNEVCINKGESGEVLLELWEESYDLKKIKTKDTVFFLIDENRP
ncbi:MAG: hypothetical protein JSS63_03990 [Bacteroidetes bacterium]|nr:hypothetical protein [Bacteroidota bacterium]